MVRHFRKPDAITHSHTNMQMVVMTAAGSRIRRLTPYLHRQVVDEATAETTQLLFLRPEQRALNNCKANSDPYHLCKSVKQKKKIEISFRFVDIKKIIMIIRPLELSKNPQHAALCVLLDFFDNKRENR